MTYLMKGLKMTETGLFGVKSKRNNIYSSLEVFQVLLLYPCLMIRNTYNFSKSSLNQFFACKKDVFYRFMSNLEIVWSKLDYHLNPQLW